MIVEELKRIFYKLTVSRKSDCNALCSFVVSRKLIAMGIFDFLKKKEFDKISELEKKIISLENSNSELNYNLTRYNGIIDTGSAFVLDCI